MRHPSSKEYPAPLPSCTNGFTTSCSTPEPQKPFLSLLLESKIALHQEPYSFGFLSLLPNKLPTKPPKSNLGTLFPTWPPLANLCSLTPSRNDVPYLATDEALTTYSPFERRAGIESDVLSPAPLIYPPWALNCSISIDGNFTSKFVPLTWNFTFPKLEFQYSAIDLNISLKAFLSPFKPLVNFEGRSLRKVSILSAISIGPRFFQSAHPVLMLVNASVHTVFTLLKASLNGCIMKFERLLSPFCNVDPNAVWVKLVHAVLI